MTDSPVISTPNITEREEYYKRVAEEKRLIKEYNKQVDTQNFDGMRSDENAHDATILRPFNSYSVVVQDTTAVFVDSVNFIGPFLKK